VLKRSLQVRLLSGGVKSPTLLAPLDEIVIIEEELPDPIVTTKEESELRKNS
jgi:hypothetical protein